MVEEQNRTEQNNEECTSAAWFWQALQRREKIDIVETE